MTVDDAMVISIPPGLPGIRNMGLAKQTRLPSNPVLPYICLTLPNLIVVTFVYLMPQISPHDFTVAVGCCRSGEKLVSRSFYISG